MAIGAILCVSIRHTLKLGVNLSSKCRHMYVQPVAQARLLSTQIPEPDTAADRMQRVRRISDRINSTNLEQRFFRLENDIQRAGRLTKSDFLGVFNAVRNSVPDTAYTLNTQIPNLSTYGQMLLRCCGSLMAEVEPQKREAIAGELWSFLKDNNVRLDISHYNNLMKIFIQNNTDFDPLKVLKEINDLELKPNRVTFQLMIHRYCLAGDIDGATKILEHMKEQSLEITESVFASLILGYGKIKQMDTAKGMLDIMRSNGLEPGAQTYAALVMARANQEPLDEACINECRKLIEEANRNDVRLSDRDYIEIIKHVAQIDQKSPFISELLAQTPKTGGFNVEGVRLVLELVHRGLYEAASTVFWSMTPGNILLQSKSVGRFYIKALSSSPGKVPIDFIIKECEELENKDWCHQPFHTMYFHAFSNGNVAVGRAALDKISARENIKCHYYWPLLAQAPNFDSVMSVLKNEINPSMDQRALRETFSMWIWPRLDQNQIAQVIKDLSGVGYDIQQLIGSYFDSLVTGENVESAIEFLKSDFANELFEKLKDPQSSNDIVADSEDIDETNPKVRGSARGNNNYMSRLLNQIANSTQNPDLVREAFYLTMNPEKGVTNLSASPLIRVHLLREDYKEAIEEFLKLAERFAVTPMKLELMKYCITEKDSASLQKIVDACNKIHGEMNALFDLAIACLDCGQDKQAQKIFNTPGFRLRQDRVNVTCETLIKAGKVSTLESLFKTTRGIFGIDRDLMYYNLLRIYAKNNDGKRALNLWTLMQEEDHQPSRRTLWYLGNVLHENGITPPFEQPEFNGKRTIMENSGRVEEFLEKIDTIKPFPLGSLLRLLSNSPEYEPKVVELCNRLIEEKDYHLPMNMVWIHLMNAKRLDEADQVFNKHLRDRQPILFAGIIDQIIANLDEELCRKLFSLITSTDLAPRSKGNIASTMLHVLTDLDKFEEAERFINEEIGKYGITQNDMNRKSLLKAANRFREKMGRDLALCLD